MSDKKILERANTEQKNFSYSKGGVSLKFSLRIDIKQELKDFRECLLAALADVEEVIKNQK